MSAPVVIATNGLGLPVKAVDADAPTLTVAANGMGVPIVLSDIGAPFVVEGLEPDEETFTATFTDDQLLAIGPVSAVSITRVSGSPVTVSLYDSAFSASGTALFSQLMSALDVEPLDLEFINGIYATVEAGGLGPELVTNGTFDTDVAGWTAQLDGVIDWVSPGRLRLTTTTSGGRATQLVSGLEVGQNYTFSAELPALTGTGGQSANVRLTTDAAGGTTGQIYQGEAVLVGSAPGSWSTTFQAATTSITVALLAGTGIAAQFDNVSLRQSAGGVPDGSFELELAA